jgi:hypothetical protein
MPEATITACPFDLYCKAFARFYAKTSLDRKPVVMTVLSQTKG